MTQPSETSQQHLQAKTWQSLTSEIDEPVLVIEDSPHDHVREQNAVIRLKLARDRAVDAGNWDTYEAQDDSFHRTVAEATDNVLLLALFDQLNQVRRAVAWNTVVRQSTRPPRDHSSFGEHDRILAAIEARDPAAAHAAMRAHLGSVSARLFAED